MTAVTPYTVKSRAKCRYEAGELSDDVARVLLGDALDEIERGRSAFVVAMVPPRTAAFRIEFGRLLGLWSSTALGLSI